MNMGKEEDKYHIRRIKELHGFGKFLFKNPIIKFLIFVVIYLILTNVEGYFSEEYYIRTIINIIGILISIYFIAVIIYLIRKSIKRLINPENIFVLILTYALFILGIILLFSTLFNIVETAKLGYIKYGTCSSKFDPSMISADPQISRDFFYFSTMTFFTVGYGDICPMGLERIVSILTTFVGHLVSVLVVALIINNYLQKKKEK
ncbi:Ion channel [uncultured archaeon]|nr:Ion channel [uncultured archaeon]